MEDDFGLRSLLELRLEIFFFARKGVIQSGAAATYKGAPQDHFIPSYPASCLRQFLMVWGDHLGSAAQVALLVFIAPPLAKVMA
jgi:hypothetical protein